MIRLAVRVRHEHAELVLAELLELVPAGVEEVPVGEEMVEYAVYGAPGELPRLPALIEAHPGVVPTTLTGSLSTGMNYGIGGANASYRTVLDGIRLGGFDLYHRRVDVVLAANGAFADRVDAGNVGLGVLRNFVATFDLGNSAMYLTPGTAFDDGRSRTARL